MVKAVQSSSWGILLAGIDRTRTHPSRFVRLMALGDWGLVNIGFELQVGDCGFYGKLLC